MPKVKAVTTDSQVPKSAHDVSKSLYKKELLKLTKKIERLEKGVANHDADLQKKKGLLSTYEAELETLKSLEGNFK